MPQTSILATPVVGFPGMKYDSGPDDAITRALEDAAGVDAGRILVWGTIPKEQCKAPAAATAVDQIAGLSLLRGVKEPASPRYAQKDDVVLARKGRYWVTAATGGLAVGSSVIYLYHATAEAGLLSSTIDTTDTVALRQDQVNVLIAAAAGAIALIEIDF